VSNTLFRAEECAVFSTTTGPYGSYSNMAAGFPLSIDGVTFRTSEALYQCFRFPHRSEIQREIVDAASPMTAKLIARRNRNESRSGWLDVRVAIMQWCVTLKLMSHPERFGREIASSGEMPIVELSSRDRFWAAVEEPRGSGLLVGENQLGSILMRLRDDLHAGDVALPVLPDGLCLLFGSCPRVFGVPEDSQGRLFGEDLTD
jgi:ribA/ribD-fused uncharacterized protein